MFFDKKIYIDPELGEIKMIKKIGVKYIRLRIKQNSEILVTLPYSVSFANALKFVINKKEWVKKHRILLKQKYDNQTIKISKERPMPLINGKIIFFQPNESSTRITLSTDSGNPKSLTLRYPTETPLAQIFEVITKILRNEARSYLPDRLKEIATKYNFKYNRVFLKNNRSNWGSCSSKKNINLNIHLMRIEPEVADFVMLHELCHLHHPNHGKGFHDLLNSLSNGHSKELHARIPRRIRF